MTATERGRHRAPRAPRTWPWQRQRAADPLLSYWASPDSPVRPTETAPGGVPLPTATHQPPRVR